MNEKKENVTPEVTEETKEVEVTEEVTTTEADNVVEPTEDGVEDLTEEQLDEIADAEVSEVAEIQNSFTDEAPVTKGEFKTFKLTAIITIAVAALLILWIACIFTEGVMDGINALSRQVAASTADKIEEPQKDVRETTVTGELTAVRSYVVNGEAVYTLRIGSDYGVDVPKHIFDELKDCTGSVITFNMYEEEKDGILSIYYDYDVEPLG